MDPDRWFNKVRCEFAPAVAPLAGKPITYVEIGCWCGASAEYVARNILTHPNSRGFGIDPYISDGLRFRTQADFDAVCEAAKQRLAFCPRWTWVRQPSQQALRLFGCPIDLLYIDGSHDAHDVLLDFCLSWDRLTNGAVVIFDDVATGWKHHRKYKLPYVPQAVEAIKAAFGKRVEFFSEGRQAAARIRK